MCAVLTGVRWRHWPPVGEALSEGLQEWRSGGVRVLERDAPPAFHGAGAEAAETDGEHRLRLLREI